MGFDKVAFSDGFYRARSFRGVHQRPCRETLVGHHGRERPVAANVVHQPLQIVVGHTVQVGGPLQRQFTLAAGAGHDGHAQVRRMLPLGNLVEPCDLDHTLRPQHQRRVNLLDGVELLQRGEGGH